MISPGFDLGLIDIKRSNGWLEEAKALPVPKPLFGEFWMEGELAILFADTGRGKSALAVQIAESIARGRAIEPFEMTAKAQKVLYLDCELTRKQFEMRYAAEPKTGEGAYRKHYKFSEKFYRAEIRRNRELPEGFETLEQYIRAALEPAVKACGARVLIVDNLTSLRGPSDSARDSLPLMRELIRLKEELGLSILVIAHTPKRSSSRRISVNDLQGSKVLANLADSIFTIGQSGIDAGIRYLKQLKSRSGETIYDEAHVPAFELKKRDGNFLGFVFRKFSEEAQHVKSVGHAVRRERAEVVAEMSKEGKSQRAIAAELGISVASVNRYLHMAEPWSDDRYNDDFFEEESSPPYEGGVAAVSADGVVLPPSEADLDKLLEEKLEDRRLTIEYMQSIGLKGPGYDDIYADIEKRRRLSSDWSASVPLALSAKREQNPGVVESSHNSQLATHDYFEDDDDDGGPMARYGLAESSHDSQLATHDYSDDDYGREETYNASVLAVGEVGVDAKGRMRRRTAWGWDYCAAAIESG